VGLLSNRVFGELIKLFICNRHEFGQGSLCGGRELDMLRHGVVWVGSSLVATSTNRVLALDDSSRQTTDRNVRTANGHLGSGFQRSRSHVRGSRLIL